jgi:hypothetical protein
MTIISLTTLDTMLLTCDAIEIELTSDTLSLCDAIVADIETRAQGWFSLVAV